MPKISVIIPVYNAEKYLRECIDSVLNQTFVDFELLLINDGSTDSSGEICDEYAKKDKRIKVFHQENKGPSAARNVGISIAKGEYLTFVDCDDYITNNYLESFILQVGNNDILFQGLNKKLESNKILKQRAVNLEKQMNDSRDLLDLINHLDIIYCGYSVGILFKTTVIHFNGLFFNEKIKKAEDLVFVLNYLQNINNIKSTNTCNYTYDFTVADSQSKKNQTEESFKLLLTTLNLILYQNLKLDNGVYPKINEALQYNFFSGMNDIINKKNTMKEKIEFLNSIDISVYKNLFTSSISLPQKILFWLLRKRFFRIYFFIVKAL